jgi:hypothetical protein
MGVFQKFSNQTANIFTLQEERDRKRERRAGRESSGKVYVGVSPKNARQYLGTLVNSY